jgi:hypothetical protein
MSINKWCEETAKKNDFSESEKWKRLKKKFPVKLLKFENLFKITEVWDEKGNFFKAKCYKSLKEFSIVKTEINNNENEISSFFDQFWKSKKLFEVYSEDFVVKYIDIFVEKSSACLPKVIVYKVLEAIEYAVINNSHLIDFKLKQKHVVKHFNEIEIIKILRELVKFFQFIQLKNYKCAMKNFMIVYSKSHYRLVVSGLVENNTPVSNPASDLLFEREQKNQNQIAKPFFNKLDIKKSSSRTNDTVSYEDQCCFEDKSQTEYVDLYEFAVKFCVGLFKDMVFVFFGITQKNQESFSSILTKEKFSKFGNLLKMFQLISEENCNQVNNKTVSKWVIEMTNCISEYFNSFFNFKNNDILLMNQPIFSGIKRIKIEISFDMPNSVSLFKFVIKELKRMKSLISIDAYFNDCYLSSEEINSLMSEIKEQPSLERLVLKLCQNNIGEEFFNSLISITTDKPLETFDVSLCEFSKKNEH